MSLQCAMSSMCCGWGRQRAVAGKGAGPLQAVVAHQSRHASRSARRTRRFFRSEAMASAPLGVSSNFGT